MTLPRTFAGIVPGLTRHYSAGPRHAYCYTYADPPAVGPRAPMQLEVWTPKGRKGGSWVPYIDKGTGAVPRYKTWRKVLPGHSHADKLSHSIKMRELASVRTVRDVCLAYCAWARAAGLKSVTVFDGHPHGLAAAVQTGLAFVAVDPSDFIGPPPAATPDTSGE
jgi:hypothetical protein